MYIIYTGYIWTERKKDREGEVQVHILHIHIYIYVMHTYPIQQTLKMKTKSIPGQTASYSTILGHTCGKFAELTARSWLWGYRHLETGKIEIFNESG